MILLKDSMEEQIFDLTTLAALNEALEYICTTSTSELGLENLAQLIVDGTLSEIDFSK